MIERYLVTVVYRDDDGGQKRLGGYLMADSQDEAETAALGCQDRLQLALGIDGTIRSYVNRDADFPTLESVVVAIEQEANG